MATMQKILAALVLAGLLAATVPARAQEREKGKKWAGTGKATVTLRLEGASMEELVRVVQKHTNRIFLYPERIRQTKVYAKGTREIPVDALYAIFQSILTLHGYTTVATPDGHGGEVIKIVTSREAMWRPSKTFGKDRMGEIPDRDQMVSLIYPLRYAKAQLTVTSLRQLVNHTLGGYIQGIQNVEVIIVSDLAPNVRRIARIIELMDVPGPSLALEVVPLTNATTEDIIQILSQLTAQTGTSGGRAVPRRGAVPPGGRTVTTGEVHFTADERTNAIIIQAMPEEMGKIRRLIGSLDVALQGETVSIHVVKLRHTNAEDMEEAVNAILDAKPTLVRRRTGAAPAAAGPRVPRPAVPSSGRPSTADQETKTAAIADRVTNSIIVVAPQAEFEEIRKVIERLDVRRPQVLVEVAIVEVNAGSGYNLGAELTTIDGARDNSTRGFAATQWGFSNMTDGDGIPVLSSGYPRGRIPTSTSGMVLGFHRGEEYSIPLLLTLLGNENDVNVISMPHIVTGDNKKAEIRVLTQEPTSTSSSTAAVSNQIGFGGFEEAGVTLIITPHISEGDYLRLEVEQNISQFSGSPTILESGGEVTGILPPGKNTNELRTVITVPNNRTVVIGGLTSTKKTKTVSKVPFLGDIPILGYLFKRETTDVKRTNLFIFITPHILWDDDFADYRRISAAHMAEARAKGVDVDQVDRHYRGASELERRMLDRPAGTPMTAAEYRRLND